MSVLTNRRPGAGVDFMAPAHFALFEAIEHNRYRQAQLLVEGGADVNGRSGRGETPLIVSCIQVEHARARAKFARLLLEARADPNIRDLQGMTALMHCSLRGLTEVVLVLLDYETTDTTLQDSLGNTALMYAAGFGHEDIVTLILTSFRNGRPSLLLSQSNFVGLSALDQAYRNGNLRVVQLLKAFNQSFADAGGFHLSSNSMSQLPLEDNKESRKRNRKNGWFGGDVKVVGVDGINLDGDTEDNKGTSTKDNQTEETVDNNIDDKQDFATTEDIANNNDNQEEDDPFVTLELEDNIQNDMSQAPTTNVETSADEERLKAGCDVETVLSPNRGHRRTRSEGQTLSQGLSDGQGFTEVVPSTMERHKLVPRIVEPQLKPEDSAPRAKLKGPMPKELRAVVRQELESMPRSRPPTPARNHHLLPSLLHRNQVDLNASQTSTRSEPAYLEYRSRVNRRGPSSLAHSYTEAQMLRTRSEPRGLCRFGGPVITGPKSSDEDLEEVVDLLEASHCSDSGLSKSLRANRDKQGLHLPPIRSITNTLQRTLNNVPLDKTHAKQVLLSPEKRKRGGDCLEPPKIPLIH